MNVRWQTILALRSDVSRALEMARQAKVIGHSLDARVTLALPPQLRSSLANQQRLLSTVFIVSQVAYASPEEIEQSGGRVGTGGLEDSGGPCFRGEM